MNIMLDTSVHRTDCSVTMPYSSSVLKFIRPIGISYTPTQKLLLPFHTKVWLGLIGCVVIIFTIGHWLFGQSLFDNIRLTFGGEILRKPIRNGTKLILGTWIISMVIMRNAYQGALFDILQAQVRFKPVATIADVSRYNYSIYASPVLVTIMERTMPHLKDQLSRQYFHFCYVHALIVFELSE